MAHTSFILPDFCLTNYTLLGIMKSIPICFAIILKYVSDCSHAQKYLQIHTHAVATFLFFIFFTTVNKSVQHMHSRYIYMGLNKNILTKNSKLKKKISEKIYYSKKKEARKIIRQHLAAQPGLATTPRQHHRQYLPLPDIEGRSALSALSIPELHPHQSHHMPLPWPAQEACAQRAAFNRHAEKNSSMGFRNGEYGGRYCTRNVGWSANQFWTGAAR